MDRLVDLGDRESRHLEPPCIKARLQSIKAKFQISLKRYSFFRSY